MKRKDLIPDDFEFKVIFNSRLKTSAGRANRYGKYIEINPHLLRKDPKTFADTLVHEICHLLSDGGHGEAWKEAMQTFGFAAERTHSMPVIRRKERRHLVYCNCRTHSFSTRRYIKWSRGHRYWCIDCGADIRKTQHR